MKGGNRSTRTSREVPYAGYSGTTKTVPANDCVLTFNTKLDKPTAASGKLKKGEIMQIALDAKNNITAFDASGNLCGYIVSPAHHKKMVDCLKKGKDYEAEVLKITASGCDVNVYGGR